MAETITPRAKDYAQWYQDVVRHGQLAETSDVRVGDWAIAVGSPFGLEQTLTVGVVCVIGCGTLTVEVVADATGGSASAQRDNASSTSPR